MAEHDALGAKADVIAAFFACMSVVVYFWPGLAALLVYDRQATLQGELWRLGTACLVHFSPSHLIWDLLVFAAAGLVIGLRGYRGLSVVCCLAAVMPSVFLLLASPDINRYGGLSGMATGGVTYLCLCEISGSERYRILWLSILVLSGVKIAVETLAQVPIFAGSSGVNFQVLPSVHAIGCGVALAAYGAMRPDKRLESTTLRAATQA